jgi:hypothetical protein
MKDNKLPLTFLLQIKRGVLWADKRVEIDKESIRYFNPSKLGNNCN